MPILTNTHTVYKILMINEFYGLTAILPRSYSLQKPHVL